MLATKYSVLIALGYVGLGAFLLKFAYFTPWYLFCWIWYASLLVWATALSGLTAAEPSHPALSPPDGVSHRGGKMVGDSLTKWEDVVAFGKLYQTTKEFEVRQEYFLRLLDYFWFSKRRIIGMKRTDIESVFGKGHPQPIRDSKNPTSTRLAWSGGRDSILIWFENDTATGAFYAMGY